VAKGGDDSTTELLGEVQGQAVGVRTVGAVHGGVSSELPHEKHDMGREPIRCSAGRAAMDV
jgi:hypothetical protein